MKKPIKITLIVIASVVGLAILVVGILLFWNWKAVETFRGNAGINETVEDIPEPDTSKTVPVSKGRADWVSWNGPNGDGRSLVKDILTDWSEGLQKLWQIEFLCKGETGATWSAPVVMGNRLVVAGRDEKNDIVFCLSTGDGSLIWEQSYPAQPASAFGKGARATAWIDNTRVYTFGRKGDLVCWNFEDGAKIWHRNVKEEGGNRPKWGHSTSPLVYENMVIVNGGGSALTTAYDKMTGDLLWKSGEGKAGYAALSIMRIGDTPVILSFGASGLRALAVKDGTQLWHAPWKTPYDANATTPVSSGDLVFISSGYGTGGQVLKVTLSEAKPVWTNKAIASHHSDPYIIDGHIYGYSGNSTQNRGKFKCVELETGTEKWSTKKMGWGTCVYVDGYLLCMDIEGNLFLMKPDPEKFIKVMEMPKALGEFKGAAWTKPVCANYRLFLRLKQRLVAYKITQ